MTKIQELEERIAALTTRLAQAGITIEPNQGAVDLTDRSDYIAHGSVEHEALLGLVRCQSEKDEVGRIVYESPKTGIRYMLEDEITPYLNFSDPRQVALLTLRSKVSVIDAGPVKVPDWAEPLHMPIE